MSRYGSLYDFLAKNELGLELCTKEFLTQITKESSNDSLYLFRKKGPSTQCGNYKNLLSPNYFCKNYVKPSYYYVGKHLSTTVGCFHFSFTK